MKARQLIGMVFGICGLSLVIIYGGWQVGLGAFLMIWGNNVQLHMRDSNELL